MKEIQTQTKFGLVVAALVICLGALLVTGCKKDAPQSTLSGTVASATCVIVPTEGNSCKGIVTFENTPVGVRIVADIEGLTANQKHGFHIHQFGDVSGLDGKSAGGHYDPQDTKNHSTAGDEKGHAGDLGNLEADGDGKAHHDATIKGISVADDKNPIIGRAIIIHAQPDDFGQPTGNAGARIGYGVIGVRNSN